VDPELKLAVVIFALAYVGIIAFRRYKELILWIAILIAIPLKLIVPLQLISGVEWNIIGIFVGSLILGELFIVSRIPESVSDHLTRRSSSTGVAFLIIIGFASFISIFIDNVATVLIVAPIALDLAKKAKVSPVAAMVGLAIASNLQGAAILIGDMPSMLLAAWMKMNFLDFFFYRGKFSIFWFIEAGAVLSFLVLYLFFRRDKAKVKREHKTEVVSMVPLYLLIIMIVLLSIASWIDRKAEWFGGVVCVAIGALGLIWLWKAVPEEFNGVLKRFDYRTLFFLIGVFILVDMLIEKGVISEVVGYFNSLAIKDEFKLLSIVVWFSVLVSAFIDNVPYITAMIPIVKGLAPDGSELQVMLIFGLLIGSCLGGNITPIGASANIVATGILKREGWDISFMQFVKIGLPFTIAATLSAYLILYVVY